jgi:hypothetical protein
MKHGACGLRTGMWCQLLGQLEAYRDRFKNVFR